MGVVEKVGLDNQIKNENNYPVNVGTYQRNPMQDSLWNMTNSAINTMGGPVSYTNSMNQMMPNIGLTSGIYQNGVTSPYMYLADPSVRELAESMHSSISFIAFPDRRGEVKETLKELAQRNPAKLAALEIVYGQMYGEPDKLRKDLRHNYTGIPGFFGIGKPTCEELQILNTAAKVSPMNSAIALHEAMAGIGTDDATVKDIINNSNPNVLSATSQYYKVVSGGESLDQAVKKDFQWFEGKSDTELVAKLNSANVNAYNPYGFAY